MGTKLKGCPYSEQNILYIRDAMDVLQGKWKTSVVLAIMTGTTRFSEIVRTIPGLSDKILTETLRTLMEDGLVERHEFDEYPPRVEYLLTEHGRSLREPLTALRDWGREHRGLMLGREQPTGDLPVC